MAEIALGWLGWSEDQALRSDVNAIVTGYNGRIDMLKAIFGGEDEPSPSIPTPAKDAPPMTAEAFDAIFGLG